MINEIKQLIFVANKLDSAGMTKEADFLDYTIKKFASDYWDGFGPDEKYDILKGEKPKYTLTGRPIEDDQVEEEESDLPPHQVVEINEGEAFVDGWEDYNTWVDYKSDGSFDPRYRMEKAEKWKDTEFYAKYIEGWKTNEEVRNFEEGSEDGQKEKAEEEGVPSASESEQFNVNDFIHNNFIEINPEFSEDFSGVEDLADSNNREMISYLIEYFDSVVERLEMSIPSGQTWFTYGEQIAEGLKNLASQEAQKSKHYRYDDILLVAHWWRQHMKNYEDYNEG